MPTKDEIGELDYDTICGLLTHILKSSRYCIEYKIIQLYELSAILVCKGINLSQVSDKACLSKIGTWRRLLYTRNAFSHNFYDTEEIELRVSELLNSGAIRDVLTYLKVDSGLIVQVCTEVENYDMWNTEEDF